MTAQQATVRVVIEEATPSATSPRMSRQGDRSSTLHRWICYGYRFEAQGKVVAISGDTVDCDGLAQLAQNADVLVHCCSWRAQRWRTNISVAWRSTASPPQT